MLTLSSEQMKEYGANIMEAIIEHFETQNNKKPVSIASRNEMEVLFDQELPEQPENPDKVLRFVLDHVMTNSNVVSHPQSYSFVPGPGNFISSMGDALASGFNIFAGGWAASPAAAQMEIVTINWFLQLFGFPQKKGGGLFTSGGSMANLTALATAREVKCKDDFSKAIIYLSDQAHSSNIKAIRVLGFKKEQIRIIPTDNEFKIALNKLKNAIAKDKLANLQPFCFIASAGTTNTGTVDPLSELAVICKKENIWLHVDAAYGGAAILDKNEKKGFKGIEKADSITVDPHKWFFQPYEIGCLLVRNHKWLKGAFTEKPEYLRDIEGNTSEINFYDHGIELTRRFRSLKLFMSFKTFGLQSFREAVTYNIELAKWTEDFLRKSKCWEVVSPATLAIINFRYNPFDKNKSEKELDKINQKISENVVASREALLVTTVLNGQVVLRMCLINPRTTTTHIMNTIKLCESFAKL